MATIERLEERMLCAYTALQGKQPENSLLAFVKILDPEKVAGTKRPAHFGMAKEFLERYKVKMEKKIVDVPSYISALQNYTADLELERMYLS